MVRIGPRVDKGHSSREQPRLLHHRESLSKHLAPLRNSLILVALAVITVVLLERIFNKPSGFPVKWLKLAVFRLICVGTVVVQNLSVLVGWLCRVEVQVFLEGLGSAAGLRRHHLVAISSAGVLGRIPSSRALPFALLLQSPGQITEELDQNLLFFGVVGLGELSTLLSLNLVVERGELFNYKSLKFLRQLSDRLVLLLQSGHFLFQRSHDVLEPVQISLSFGLQLEHRAHFIL